MPVDDLLFLHPLLGADDSWSGYLVETAADATPEEKTLARLCLHPTVAEFDHRQPWLLPTQAGIGSKSRISNLVQVFTSATLAATREHEENLRKGRNTLGLAVASGEKLPMTGTWDYLLLSASHARTLPPFTLLGLASRTIIVITDVHSHADYTWSQGNACTLATAEFLLTRNNTGKRADMTRIKLLEMLTLIAEDADTAAIEAIFRQEPKLSYSLLRLVNSAALAPRSPITSFVQAINLLGRRQLQRWLQLLVYADPDNGHSPNPLLQKAAARGRLLELLSPSLTPAVTVDNPGDAAFMIGVFSLLDALLNMSMSEILQQLPLQEVVHQALAEHAGPLGQLLQAINSAESRDLKTAARQLEALSISGETFLEAQLTALSWAAKIHPAP